METGTVKFFKVKEGWGFIQSEGINEDIFVHYSNITGEGFKTLESGEEVTFDLKKGERGYQAMDVQRVNKQEMAPRVPRLQD
ncbi:MAG: cold-shock protein [Planctomycetota bacterium]|jgi:CspA family cold shock protein